MVKDPIRNKEKIFYKKILVCCRLFKRDRSGMSAARIGGVDGMAVDVQKRNKRQYAWQKDKTDRINFIMPKGMKQQIKEAALKEKEGKKPSEFIRDAIVQRIEMVNEPYFKDTLLPLVKSGLDLNKFINEAISEKIERDSFLNPPEKGEE